MTLPFLADENFNNRIVLGLMPIALVIDEVLLIAAASEPDEWRDSG